MKEQWQELEQEKALLIREKESWKRKIIGFEVCNIELEKHTKHCTVLSHTHQLFGKAAAAAVAAQREQLTAAQQQSR